MAYFILALSVLFMGAQSVIGAQYNRLNEGRRGTAAMYNLLLLSGAVCVYAVSSCIQFEFHAQTLWFSLGFGACFALTQCGFILALKRGPVALTSLMMQLSLIGTVIYGFIFWDEKATAISVVGLVLVVISLVLCLCGQKKGGKANWAWFGFAMLMFLGNAGCSIVQKSQQLAYDGNYKNMFMLFAMIFSLSITAVMFFVGDKMDAVAILRKSWFYPVLTGILNALMNLFVMIMANLLPSSVVYPVISVGGLILTALASLLLFKEKLRPAQWAGMGLGCVSVILLAVF